MSVDFTYTGPASYRTYLAGMYQREKIDIAIAKPVRAAVGSVEEIYGSDRPALRAALRDFHYGGPDAPCEVLTVNLHYACAALDPVAADIVSGFQSLFEEDAPAVRAAGDESEVERLLARLAVLTARQQFADALRFVNAVLVEYPAVCAQDSRFEWLRATLLAGIAGQPKSLAVLDLPAAERAFLKIAARAERDRPVEAAAALVAAGKCAYAAGRFADADAHCWGALECDPRSAEAHYQMARLRRHAGDLRVTRECLILAFGLKYGYALRAASDPLFRADVDLVRACVIAATRNAAKAARETLAEGLARLRFLARHSDRDHPAAALERFASTREEIAALAGAPAAATLRPVLRQRKAASATRAPVLRLAQDYCKLLRANEETIARRAVERRRAPADPDRVARWLTRATEASVAVVLIAVVAGTFDFASAAAFPDWNATASASALGLALAVANLWLLMHTSFLRRPTRSFYQRAVVAVQGWSSARFERRLPHRIARNRRRLHKRIRRIEWRFGLDRTAT
jgi:tetratricopeptide (TPR) repeat protein